MLMSDEAYLRAAYDEAIKSGDLSTQNGAVLVDPNNGAIVAAGWNDIHPPLRDLPERRQRPLKYDWTAHAEFLAVLAAARSGVATAGLWMFCPWFACVNCGLVIVHAGIVRVVGHSIPQHRTRPDWAASIATADQMFAEADIEVLRVEGRLGQRVRFAGEEIEV